jgi:hypothetical protein
MDALGLRSDCYRGGFSSGSCDRDLKGFCGLKPFFCLGVVVGSIFFPGAHSLKSFLISMWVCRDGFVFGIKGEISEEMVMFMTSPTSEWNVFIVQSLNPFIVLIVDIDYIWKWLGEIHIDTHVCICCVAICFGDFKGFNKPSQSVSNAFKNLFILEFLGNRIDPDLDR